MKLMRDQESLMQVLLASEAVTGTFQPKKDRGALGHGLHDLAAQAAAGEMKHLMQIIWPSLFLGLHLQGCAIYWTLGRGSAWGF